MKQDNRGHWIVSMGDLEIKGRRSGGNVRSTCPVCREQRHHGAQACVSINMETGWGRCFKCGAVFVMEDKYEDWKSRYAAANKQKTFTSPDVRRLSDSFTTLCMQYLKLRCISPETAHKAGVSCMQMTKPDGTHKDYLAFRYIDGNNTVNIQFKRADPTCREFFFSGGSDMIPWNINAALGTDTLIITEGMMDALAVMESGSDNVISVSNGAKTDMSTFDKYKTSHLDGIREIIFAGDTDSAGLELRATVLKYFGEARCKVVTWEVADEETGGKCVTKDANEMLMKRGRDAVAYCLQHAHEIPISGIDTLDGCEDMLDGYYRDGFPKSFGINLHGFDHLIHFQPSRIIFGLATPGSGKSAFTDYAMLRLAYLYGWKVAIFSPEKFPVARHYAELISIVTGKAFDKRVLTEGQYRRAKKFVSEHIFEISPEKNTDVDSILKEVEQLNIRKGINLTILDPFNWIQLPMISGANDAQKYNEVIMAIQLFAHKHDMPFLIQLHPRKTDGKMKLTAYDAFGSSDFINKADIFYIMERDVKSGLVFIRCVKVRFPDLGQIGTIALSFNRQNGRYVGCREIPVVEGQVRYDPLPFDNTDWLSIDAREQDLSFDAFDIDTDSSDDDLPF
jgi:twinkle protein